MKKFLVGSMIIVFAASICSAAVFKIIKVDNTESTVIATKKKTGEKLYQATSWGDIVKEGDKTYVRKFEKGAGIKKDGYRTWTAENIFLGTGERMIPVSTKAIYKDKDGKVVKTVNANYDRANNKVTVKTNDEVKTFDFEDDLINAAMLGTALRNYPFASDKDVEFHMMASGPQVFKMTMKNHGIDVVTTPDGKEIECYKLQMIPDLGVLGFVGAFVPKTYFWYEAAEPHRFVKYEGLDGGLGTPYMVYQLSNYDEF